MKQILQNLKTGETNIVEVPSPPVTPNHVRIKTSKSLISAGTERMLVDFGRANYLDKARQQPEKVAQVIRKVSTDGLMATIDTVKAKLDEPQALGYSNVGVVTDLGAGVEGFQVGDRVVSNGRHAEIVNVPMNLCAKIPDQVNDEAAAFTVVASIGLQGVRLLQPSLGEYVVVYGLGLIGMLTAQILKANGCNVLGLDVSKERVSMAESLGFKALDLSSGLDPVSAAFGFSGGKGVDGVIITASSKDDSLIQNAAQMCRKRGRIVLVGVIGLKLNRSDFYEKELSFQVSCSYGPGRYDPFYEEQGNDYPIGFVRWTEQRNFQAVLALMAEKKLITESLISLRTPLENAAVAYEGVVNGSVITAILEYPNQIAQDSRVIVNKSASSSASFKKDEPRVAVIGAGNFTKARLAPALKKQDIILDTIVSAQGVTSASAASKFGFINNSNDENSVWSRADINTVFITTRHDSHGALVKKALETGKHVFVEKPLTINESELLDIKNSVASFKEGNEKHLPLIMVGFNRRFSPLVKQMKKMLSGRSQPMTAIYTANAGDIPADHWTQDMKVGGGRILGEACHFVDTLVFLVGSPIKAVSAIKMADNPSVSITQDKMTIVLEFQDGSHGTVHYFANGSKDFSKERIEVFTEGKILQLDNFRNLKSFGFGIKGFGLPKLSQILKGQNKGHNEGFFAFIDAIRNGLTAPIPFSEIINVSEACFAIIKSAETQQRIVLDEQ